MQRLLLRLPVKALTLLLVHLQGHLLFSTRQLNLTCIPPTLGICIESLESIWQYCECSPVAGGINHLRWGELCLRLRLHLLLQLTGAAPRLLQRLQEGRGLKSHHKGSQPIHVGHST